VRDDDQPEAVRVRMQASEESTQPLKEFYRMKGCLFCIPAEGSAEEVHRRTMMRLAKPTLGTGAAGPASTFDRARRPL
jgi:adenylate kinase family enzyme